MEKALKKENDVVNPDLVKVESLGLYLKHVDKDVITFSFDGDKIYSVSKFTHPYIHKFRNGKEMLDLRYWSGSNIMTLWIYDNCVEKLKSFYDVFKKNEIDFVKRNRYKQHIDIDNVNILFTKKEGDEEYIVKCHFNELDELYGALTNYDKRPFHLLPPSVKKQIIENNEELIKERNFYNREGNRAWKTKHGNIDMAEYHLLKYEE